MRKSLKTVVIAAGTGALVLGSTAAFTGTASAAGSKGLKATGLVGGTRLVSFNTGKPGATSRIGTVKGLGGGDSRLVGIDYRVQDGKLYGVGDKGGVYTLSTRSAAAKYVLRLSVGLEGRYFGVDFNPAANALRVVSDTGQNLRQPFATEGAATVADTPLSTPPTAGVTTGVSAAAYTNNDSDEQTATTLYDINATADTVAVQAPANAGTLSPTGGLKVDAGSDAGFDIFTKVRRGTAVGQAGFARLSVKGHQGLYRVSQAHLDGCPDCRAELAELAPLAEDLRLVDPDRMPGPAAPPAELGARIGAAVRLESQLRDRRDRVQSRRRRIKGVLVPASAAVAAAAATVLVMTSLSPAQPEPTPVAAEHLAVRTVSNRITGTDAELVPHTWGLEVKLVATGLDAGTTYRAVVLTRDGRSLPAGAFLGTGSTPVRCNLQAALLRDDAVGFSIEDAATGKVVLTATLPTLSTPPTLPRSSATRTRTA